MRTSRVACRPREWAAWWQLLLPALLLAVTDARGEGPGRADFSRVPGVVIHHSPASSGVYVGSPALAVLPDGRYVAAHDEFGPKSSMKKAGVTRVFRSDDKGRTWEPVAKVEGAFWSSLFVHRGALYLAGTSREYGDLVIRRSTDGGATWTTPKDKASGLLAVGQYHCAPVPVVEHAGRVWRGVEDVIPGAGWPGQFRTLMTSAPADADLLDAKNWTFTNAIASNPLWLGAKFGGWLEGNAVVAPGGAGVVNVLRVDYRDVPEKAAIISVSRDGHSAYFRALADETLVDFPGGSKKFTIRYDPQSKAFWSLTNWAQPRDGVGDVLQLRNTLALARSGNLMVWELRSIVLRHPDPKHHAFQYADWHFDGDDLIAVCRTAFDDGLGGAHSAHDANFLTFHRIPGFRTRTMKDAPVGG